MNIVVQNRRNVEFDLADLDVYVKEFIEDAGVIVCSSLCSLLLSIVLSLGGEAAISDMDPEEKILWLWQDA